MRVLLMEDDAAQARLMQRTLERADYAVDIAATGDVGLALYAAGAYDVLLIAPQMPGHSGLEILRMLATRGALPPTIMVTGPGDETMAVAALQLGAGDYIVKDGDGRYLTLLPTVVARVLHQQRLQAEKQQAEEQCRVLFEAAPDAMVLVQADGRIVRVNAQAEQLFGYPRHELLGRPVDLLVPERFRAAHREHVRRYGAAPRVRPMGRGLALYGRCKDGREVPVEISLSPLQTVEGLLVVSAIRDVTARQEAEVALRQRAALLDLASDAILVFDMAQRLVFWNRAAEVCYGWTQAEALGHRPHTLLQTVFPEPLAAIQEALLHYGRWEGELVHTTRAGTRLVVASRWAVQREAMGQPIAILEINTDITERKQAEAALQQPLEWLNTTLASIGDAVIATDSAGTITFLNPAAAQLTGWPAQEALGQPIATVLRLCHAQTHQAMEGPVHRVLRTGEVVSLVPDTLLVTRHGQEIPVTDRAAPIRGRQGTPQGVVLVLRDLSAYKDLEAQLQQAQKMEAIGTLASGIAHDFNNILAAILGFTELATYDVPQSSAIWHNLHQVLTAGKRAKDLVQQILAFSRRTLPERRPLTLHTLVQDALGLLRASLPSTIPIRTHLAEEAGVVLADATQLHQVLLNLCANAEYAMRTTGGVLEVRLEAVEVAAPLAVLQATLPPGAYVRLTVRDTGHGMAPDVVARLCEPYFTTKPPGEGSGLGLAVVHGILTQHGGGLAVTSVPRHGTTFEVYLPRLAETAPDRPPPAEAPLPGGTERLLFVDDEPALAALAQEVLTRLGYHVVACCSSREALDTFRATAPPFDVVITDQTMPELTGDVLARTLRQLRPDLPVILCTGFSHTMDTERARAAGITALVTKPWQVRELAHTIRHVLDQQVH